MGFIHLLCLQLQAQQGNEVAPLIGCVGLAHQRAFALSLGKVGLAVRVQGAGQLPVDGAQSGFGVLRLLLGLALLGGRWALGLALSLAILLGLSFILHLSHQGCEQLFGRIDFIEPFQIQRVPQGGLHRVQHLPLGVLQRQRLLFRGKVHAAQCRQRRVVTLGLQHLQQRFQNTVHRFFLGSRQPLAL